MSSYFDKMGRCLNDPWEVVSLMRKQYGAYLSDLQERVVPADEDKLGELVVQFVELEVRPSVLTKRDPEWAISDMHDLAHRVGQSGIRLKDGGRAGDNPNIMY
jgi:hypothetical protein